MVRLRRKPKVTCPTRPGCFMARPPLDTAAATFPSRSTTTAPTVSRQAELFSSPSTMMSPTGSKQPKSFSCAHNCHSIRISYHTQIINSTILLIYTEKSKIKCKCQCIFMLNRGPKKRNKEAVVTGNFKKRTFQSPE